MEENKTVKVKTPDFKSYFDTKILRKGQQYYQAGNVVDIALIDECVIRAKVKGTILYTIIIRIVNDEIQLKCNCPFMGGNCKHEAAVLYYLEENEIKLTNDSNVSLDISVQDELALMMAETAYEAMMDTDGYEDDMYEEHNEYILSEIDGWIYFVENEVEDKNIKKIDMYFSMYDNIGKIDFSEYGLAEKKVGKLLLSNLPMHIKDIEEKMNDLSLAQYKRMHMIMTMTDIVSTLEEATLLIRCIQSLKPRGSNFDDEEHTCFEECITKLRKEFIDVK
ncbi:MAG: hypothetical protein RR481_05330 [Longicatena sp.]